VFGIGELKMLTKSDVIRALTKLEENWPEDLWIFANGDNLYLLRTDENGKCAYTGPGGSVDQKYIIGHFAIPNDGGGF
jgi:hypothetical protein